MHAVLITFATSAEISDLEAPFAHYARALGDVPGLISKTWIVDDDRLGGFHLFATSDDADAYLAGPLLGSVCADPAFSAFSIAHYDVLDDLSALTNGLGGRTTISP